MLLPLMCCAAPRCTGHRAADARGCQRCRAVPHCCARAEMVQMFKGASGAGACVEGWSMVGMDQLCRLGWQG